MSSGNCKSQICLLTRASFVDRDMFMRHLGGGIGHVNNVHPFSSATNSEGYLEDGGDNDDDEVDSAAIDLTTLGHIQ